ncbi:MAG: hypothetical protein AAGA58_07470 [Verrucomicrobiota bacterium]
MRKIPAPLLGALAALSVSTPALAQSIFNDLAPGDSDWSNAGNWSPAEPALADDAEIGAGLTAEITQTGEEARILDVSNGATVNMTGGDFTFRALNAGSGSTTGTFNFIDGTITATNNIAGEAIQLGNSGGGNGIMVMGNGTTTPVLNYSGGRFEVGTANNAMATFTLESGSIVGANQNFIIGQGDANSVSTVIVNGGSFDNGTADTNMNDGNSSLTMNGGTWSTAELRYTNNASSSVTLNNGSTMTISLNLEDRGGASTLNLNSGATLEFLGGVLREVDTLNVTGGNLRITPFSTPLQVFGTASISGSPVVDFLAGGGTGGGPALWIGGTDTWVNADTSNWQGGVSPDGTGSAGATFNIISAGTLTGGNNFTISDPNWSATVVGNDLQAESVAAFSTDPLTAIFSDGSATITRNSDLRLAPTTGADAASVEISAGTLNVTGTNEMILGLPGSTPTVIQTGGTVNLSDDLRYIDSGGIYRLRGGTLNVSGEVIEDNIGVANAQLYVGGGFLNVTGDITTQSFRTGDSTGFPGEYFHATGRTITNTGTFYTGLNAIGFFTVSDGVIDTGALIISDQNGAENSEIVMEGGLFVSSGQVDIGRRGDDDGGSFLLAGGGTFISNGTLRFGNNGGTGTLQVDNASGGGIVVANSTISIGGGGQADVLLFDGGEFALGGDPGARTVTNFSQFSGGKLGLRVPTDLTMAPLTATNSVTVNSGALVDVDAGFGTGSTSDSATWIAGNGDWDVDANWLASDGITNIVPAQASGITTAATEIPYLVAPVGTILNPANVTANAGWQVVTPTSGNMNELAVSRTGGGFGTGPGLAIINNGSTVTRDSDTSFSTDGGSTAAGLNINGGSQLNVSNATSDPHLTIGGGAQATVNQGILGVSDATAVLVEGDLRFGGLDTEGGTYNLRSGTLTVQGSVIEGLTAGNQDSAVNNAQMQINTEEAGNANALNVSGSIEVQRFAVAQDAGAGTAVNPITHTLDGLLTTSGDMIIGMGVADGPNYAHGEFIADGTGGPIFVNQLVLGSEGNQGAADPTSPNGGSSGVMTLSGSQVLTLGGGRFTVGGEAQDDYGTSGSFTMGGTSTVTVPIQNSEIGRGGTGAFTMTGGTFNQLASNFVLGQSGTGGGAASDPASGTVMIMDIDGTTILNVGDAANGASNTDLNFNDGFASFTQTGTNTFVNVERNLNMGGGSSNPSSYALTDGTLNIGANLDMREGSAQDTLTIAGSATLDITGNLDVDGGSNNAVVINGSNATINVGGNALMSAATATQFVLDVGGASVVSVTGNLTTGGTLNVDVSAIDTVFGTAHCLQRIDLFAVTGSVSGAFSNVAIGAAVPGAVFSDGSVYLLQSDASGLFLAPSGGINLLDDDDNDRILNLVEIGHGTDFNRANSGQEGLPTVSASGGNLTIQYRQLLTPGDITYTIEQSDDLVNWVPLGEGTATATNPTPTTVLYELTISMADARKFIHVLVSK